MMTILKCPPLWHCYTVANLAALAFRMCEVLIFQHLERAKLGFLREHTRTREIGNTQEHEKLTFF